MARKTFNEKLQDSKNLPKIETITDETTIARHGGSRMLIAPPLIYDELMSRVPEGQLITQDQVRSFLAAQYKADFTCPMTAGIFVSLCARASEERVAEDEKARETPYWRTLKKAGELNDKYPGGAEVQKARLELEGHKIRQKGKKYFVENYENKLYKLESEK